MKLFVVGANGQIGQHLVSQALKAGHTVTAFVRRAGTLPESNPNLSIVLGDVVHDAAALQQSSHEHDAVISTLGNGLLIKGTGSPKIMLPAVTNIMSAMTANGIRRLALVLAYGAGASLSHAPLFIRMICKTVLRKDFQDLSAAEASITKTDLDWTIGYFGSLTDAPLSDRYGVSTSLQKPKQLRISRADVAHFLLKAAVDRTFLQQRVTLSGSN
jgi:putative NADH-flavin reductase